MWVKKFGGFPPPASVVDNFPPGLLAFFRNLQGPEENEVKTRRLTANVGIFNRQTLKVRYLSIFPIPPVINLFWQAPIDHRERGMQKVARKAELLLLSFHVDGNKSLQDGIGGATLWKSWRRCNSSIGEKIPLESVLYGWEIEIEEEKAVNSRPMNQSWRSPSF